VAYGGSGAKAPPLAARPSGPIQWARGDVGLKPSATARPRKQRGTRWAHLKELVEEGCIGLNMRYDLHIVELYQLPHCAKRNVINVPSHNLPPATSPNRLSVCAHQPSG